MSTNRTVGVETAVLRHLPLDELLDELGETGIRTVELWRGHCSAEDDEADIEAAERALDAAGVSVCGYGVVDLDGVEVVRPHVAFAARLGAAYVAVNYPPARDDITTALVDAAEEYDVDIAIHNYSSVHHDDLATVFSSIDDVREVLARYDHPRLGVCVDTGHFLVEEVDPEAVVRELGDRVVCVHLKDTSEEEVEDVPGAGRLDLPSVLGLVDEYVSPDAPLIVEYELPTDRAAAALGAAETNVRAALR